MERKKGKIITITSTKGGVGKTITVLNLAGVYHLENKKVLVIDLDLYGGNIATAVNSNNDKTIYTLVDDFNNNRYKDINNYLFKYNENISILAAPKDPRQANKIDKKYINLILGNVISKFDVVLIDTTHVLDEINIITLDASDVVVYIYSNDAFDIKNSKSFVSIIKDAEIDNFYTLLNESIISERNYFSYYDIKNITKTNIDFIIPKNFHIKDIDRYIMEGTIPLLNKNLGFKNRKDFKKFMALANTLLKDKEE